MKSHILCPFRSVPRFALLVSRQHTDTRTRHRQTSPSSRRTHAHTQGGHRAVSDQLLHTRSAASCPLLVHGRCAPFSLYARSPMRSSLSLHEACATTLRQRVHALLALPVRGLRALGCEPRLLLLVLDFL